MVSSIEKLHCKIINIQYTTYTIHIQYIYMYIYIYNKRILKPFCRTCIRFKWHFSTYTSSTTKRSKASLLNEGNVFKLKSCVLLRRLLL